MKTKTIIISSQKENSNARGILTVFSENGILSCRIRLYNVNNLSKFCKLGIYHENEVFSGNLLENDGVFTCAIVGDFDIDKDFYSAIVDTSNNNEVILSGGTYAGYYFNDDSVFNDLTYDVEPIPVIESDSPEVASIHDCSDCEKCSNCEYKKYFFEHNAEYEEPPIMLNTPKQDVYQTEKEKMSDDELEKVSNEYLAETIQTDTPNAPTPITEIPAQSTGNLFSTIIPQFKYVFENYEANTQLNNLIPNSKFVSICEGGESYSIGAIYSNDEIKFLCYAVQKENSINPPAELGEHYQWLPLDIEDPLSEGYFVVFQDAHDLKIVEL